MKQLFIIILALSFSNAFAAKVNLDKVRTKVQEQENLLQDFKNYRRVDYSYNPCSILKSCTVIVRAKKEANGNYEIVEKTTVKPLHVNLCSMGGDIIADLDAGLKFVAQVSPSTLPLSEALGKEIMVAELSFRWIGGIVAVTEASLTSSIVALATVHKDKYYHATCAIETAE